MVSDLLRDMVDDALKRVHDTNLRMVSDLLHKVVEDALNPVLQLSEPSNPAFSGLFYEIHRVDMTLKTHQNPRKKYCLNQN